MWHLCVVWRGSLHQLQGSHPAEDRIRAGPAAGTGVLLAYFEKPLDV